MAKNIAKIPGNVEGPQEMLAAIGEGVRCAWSLCAERCPYRDEDEYKWARWLMASGCPAGDRLRLPGWPSAPPVSGAHGRYYGWIKMQRIRCAEERGPSGWGLVQPLPERPCLYCGMMYVFRKKDIIPGLSIQVNHNRMFLDQRVFSRGCEQMIRSTREVYVTKWCPLFMEHLIVRSSVG